MSYLLFAGEDYYPSGGMQDYWGTFDTIDKAKEHYDRLIKENRATDPWGEIYDDKLKKSVLTKSRDEPWSEEVATGGWSGWSQVRKVYE